MAQSRTILVAGGGIAGLSAALALAEKGFRVEVFEKASDHSEEGAGIQISPNALRVLDLLGAGTAVRRSATAPQGIHIRSAPSGRLVNTVPLGALAIERFGLPYLNLHRADLHQALAIVAAEHPDIVIHAGTEVTDFTGHAQGVTLLARHSRGISEFRGRMLVGADGIHSAVRVQLAGAAAARPSGLVAWRGMIPDMRLPGDWDRDHSALVMGPGAHGVFYPVRKGRYLNAVIVTREPEGARDVDRAPDPALLLASLKPWHESILAVVKAVERWTLWPLRVMPSRPMLASGGVALVGDAAHGMLPFAAQGAAMAIEDAHVLARHLAASQDSAAALAAYGRERSARVERVMRLARLNGWIYHLPAPFGLARNLAIASTQPRSLLERQAWIYDWKPDA